MNYLKNQIGQLEEAWMLNPWKCDHVDLCRILFNFNYSSSHLICCIHKYFVGFILDSMVRE